MRTKICLVILLPLLLLALPSQGCFAEADWQNSRQLNLPDSPMDMKFSRDGKWLYLLTDNGELLIYDHQGQFKDKITVGKQFQGIEPGPYENEVYLRNPKKNLVQVIEIAHAQAIDISGSPYKGPEDAPVVIVEFTDFQCPYCAKLVDIFEQLMQRYPGKLKIVYKSFPLGNHKFAYRAATAAMAAHQKERFWEFHDRLFENHKDIDDAKILDLRKEFGFDTPGFAALMNAPETRSQVAKDRKEGQRVGVRGTPTVFINGKRLKDKRLEGFIAAIEKELKKLR